MSADPLAAFRRPGSRPAAEARDPPPKAEAAGYRAFYVSSGKPPTRLEFRMKNGVSVFKAYASITEITYERKTQKAIVLQYSNKEIAIAGRNLAPVLEAIKAGTCEWVAELEEGDSPPHGQPVIEAIKARPVAPPGAARPAAPKKEP